jgi:hypothetical protein
LLSLLVGFKLLDGELSGLTLPAKSLVYSAICTTADETNYLVSVYYPYFALVTDRTDAFICRICT